MFDISHLKRIGPLGQLAPASMAGFKALDEAALTAGAIPKKYKELMAIAVALTTPRTKRLQSPCLSRPRCELGRRSRTVPICSQPELVQATPMTRRRIRKEN
jgi:hypothetical protein